MLPPSAPNRTLSLPKTLSAASRVGAIRISSRVARVGLRVQVPRHHSRFSPSLGPDEIGDRTLGGLRTTPGMSPPVRRWTRRAPPWALVLRLNDAALAGRGSCPLGRRELQSDDGRVQAASILLPQEFISANGRWVVFQSKTNLVPGDTNAFVDVFVHDRLTGDLKTRRTTSSR